jgi:hypothetical protein
MRGMQVVEQPKGATLNAAKHVALQEWCGFSKLSGQSNEWLIVNYIVRFHSPQQLRNICAAQSDCLTV